MLKIDDPAYFESVKAFAKSRGLEAQLQEKLDYLDHYACKDPNDPTDDRAPDATRCLLFKDFAPYSFEFVMERKVNVAGTKDEDRAGTFEYRRWFNGGLIYFGAGDTGAGAPQLSVRIGSTDEGWSIHT